MVGPLCTAAAETPGAGRDTAARPAVSRPTSVALRWTAALGVQNASGANITQTPSAATTQRAAHSRQDSDSAAKPAMARPEITSLAIIRGSSVPSRGGEVASQSPRPMFAQCAQRFRRCASR